MTTPKSLNKYLISIVLVALVGHGYAQNNLHDFSPSAGGNQQLFVAVGPGEAFVGTTATAIPRTVITLAANTTNYIYVDLVGGTVTSNTSGFTSTVYPIAIAVTNNTSVSSLTDVRPGAFGSAASGSGSVTSVATTGPLSGGPITTTGTIACATCVTASTPGSGIGHFAGSTQALTSSAINLASADVTGLLPITNGGTGTGSPALIAGTNITITGSWPNQTINSSGGGGSGTVTSFSAGTLSPLFTTSVATSTSTPALTFTLSSAAQNSVFAGPASGGAAAPSFQTAPTISAANMTNFPTFNQNTTGTAGGLSGSPAITVSSCSGCGGGFSGLTTGVIPQAGSGTTIVNTSPQLDNGVTATNTLTYVGSGGVSASAGPLSASAPSGGIGSSIFLTQEGTVPSGLSTAAEDNCYSDSTQHGILCNFNAGTTLPLTQGPASDTSGHVASFSGTNGGKLADSGAVAANLVVASSPGAGIAHFAGSTQTVTSSTVSLTADVSGVLPFANMSQNWVTNAQTATYQVLAADFAGCKTIPVASGTFTITLVASGSQPASGQCIEIINYGSGVVTVARSGQNINGAAANLTIPAGSASAPTGVFIVSDGTNYVADTQGGSSGGSGTVTVVSSGSLTSTALVTGGGTTTLQTPSATATLSSGGALSIPGTIATGTVPTVTTPGSGFYVFGTEGTEPVSIAASTDGFVFDSTSHCPIQWSNAANVGCSAALGATESFTAAQTFTGGVINTTTPIRDQTRFVLAANMTAVSTAGVNIGSTGAGNSVFSWPVTAANWYDLSCKLPVTFVASATISFKLVSISGSVTVSNVNSETMGNTGASAAFQDLTTIAGTTIAGSATPTTGAPGGVSETITVNAQFLTSHAGNIGLAFVGNGTNNVQMLLGGECGITQIN